MLNLPNCWKVIINRKLKAFVLIILAAVPMHSHAKFWIDISRDSTQGKADTFQSSYIYGYRIEVLKRYAFVYMDRDFAFTKIPECLEKAHYVVTANSDKFSRGSNLFSVNYDRPFVIYVGYDRRYKTMPEWLGGFREVPGNWLAMGDPKYGKDLVGYRLFTQKISGGSYQLGGNLSEREESNFAMYTVLLVDAQDDRCRW